MKIIDLLNKIANEEEVPKKIKLGLKTYHFCKSCGVYEDEYERDLVIRYDMLNDEVEIIKEQQDIDIQGIEEIQFPDNSILRDTRDLIINELVQAVKKLDKKINDN